jgi:hypothetical protein
VSKMRNAIKQAQEVMQKMHDSNVFLGILEGEDLRDALDAADAALAEEARRPSETTEAQQWLIDVAARMGTLLAQLPPPQGAWPDPCGDCLGVCEKPIAQPHTRQFCVVEHPRSSEWRVTEPCPTHAKRTWPCAECHGLTDLAGRPTRCEAHRGGE